MLVSKIIRLLPSSLEWIVLFNLPALRPIFDDNTIKRMYFMPEDLSLDLYSHAILTSAGLRLAPENGSRLIDPKNGGQCPLPQEKSLLDRFSSELACFSLDEADCLGIGEIDYFFPPAVLNINLRNHHGKAKALFYQQPSQMHYELLRAVGVEFLSGEWQDQFYFANFSIDLSKHILAGELSDFSKTGYCNAFFLQQGSIGAKLEAGLVEAAQHRVNLAEELGLQSTEQLGQQALDYSWSMSCQPPPPRDPFPFGDLVPLGFQLSALSNASSASGSNTANNIRQWLNNNRQGKLWPFQSGDIATSTDSALILLGMKDPEAVEALEVFANGIGGYYPQLWSSSEHPDRMVVGDLNRHWCQSDFATTCLVRALRNELGLPPKTSLDYLAAGFQNRSGLYFANPYLTDWALALAIKDDESAKDLRHKLLGEVLGSMNQDHTFGKYDIPLSTAIAILCLATLGYCDRKLLLAQLRLAEFIEPEGAWPIASPFYSTFKAPDILSIFAQPEEQQYTSEDQIVLVYGKYYLISYYIDQHKLISTAVAALALSAGSSSTKQDSPVEVDFLLEKHPRYCCQSHTEYIVNYALPPYIRNTVIYDV